MKFGKIVDGQIEYAEDSRWIDGAFHTKLTLQQHLAFGEKPIYDIPCGKKPTSGFHYVKDGWIEQACAILPKWKLEQDPQPAVQLIRISKSKVENAIDRMQLTEKFTAWLQSKASYFGRWMRSDDVIEYSPMDNASDLASLLDALGISQDQVPSLIEEVRA